MSASSSIPTPIPATRRRRARSLGAALVVLVLVGIALCTWAKGRGYKTRLVRVAYPAYGRSHGTPRPAVVRTRPFDREGNVAPDAFIAADVDLPFSGHVVDEHSLNAASVRLYRTNDHRFIQSVVNTSGAGDAIVLRPMEALETNTQYTFEVTGQARDTGGHPFRPYSATFWTAAGQRVGDFPAAFSRVPLPNATGHMFTCVTIGPDHKLYATTLTGKIFRHAIRADGTLEGGQLIETLKIADGGAMRLITGITFDPASTADHLVLWVSHGELPPDGQRGQALIRGAHDWTGKISRLTGPDLDACEDVVVRLPRAWKDHLNNQPVFGPDGALYFCQAGNTAMGAPDHKWGYRPESLLTASILRLDVKALEGHTPLDAKTEGDGRYDPFAPGAPLTIYASGVRNSFDLVWHSNGRLYAAINGSAAYGNTPATPAEGADKLPRLDAALRGPYLGPIVPGVANVTETEDDMLFRVDRGGYYGHPNPARAEYVLNGGNPAPHASPYQVNDYPLGVRPDRNWRPAIFSFGKNLSPCGGIEYQSDVFGGALKHKLLFVRYSGGDDIIAFGLDGAGDVAESITNIDGLTHFVNPVDLTEDPATGSLYVAEFGAKRLTLLRPVVGGGGPLASGGSHQVCRVRLTTQALTSGHD